MAQSQSVDERSRLLPAIPHRSYVYADELVGGFFNKESMSSSQMPSVVIFSESDP